MTLIKCSIRHFKTELWHFISLLYVSVQSDLILPELQQHLFQKRTVLQQHIVDELMK